MDIHEKFMKEALREAKKAYDIGEVPIGAVIVKDNKIIAKAYNKKEIIKDVTSHAEIIAIKKASKKLENWRLNDCTLYVTLKPCDMCFSAIIQSRIKNIFIGTNYKFLGATESHLLDDDKIKDYLNVNTGILEEECSQILKEFFKSVRKK